MMMNEDQSLTASETTSGSHLRAIVGWLLLVAVAFGLLAAVMSWIAKSTTIASPITAPAEIGGAMLGGEYPPLDFRLASLDGGMVGPADFPGEVVLVEFWATWCGPCRKQAEYLEEVYRDVEGKGVRFLAVDVGEDEERVRRYVQREPFPYPVLLDPQDTVSPRYQVFGLPTVLIVDRQGAIAYLQTGVSAPGTLRRALAAAGAT